MRKQLYTGTVFGIAMLALSGTASAGGIVEACYNKSYVDAKYVYGRSLIKNESRQWTNLDNGPGLVTRVRHPSVYVQTSRKVANDHYILVPVACR